MASIANRSESNALSRSSPRLGTCALAALSGIGLAFVIAVTVMCGLHIWNYDPQGRPIVNDFVSFWSAGQLVLHGHPLAAYDQHLRHAAEVATVGHPFDDVRGWWYPPLFLFVAAALAIFPYSVAFNIMNDVTLLLHALMTGAITRHRAASFLAAATPWGWFGMIHGQNQFITATLVGGVLLTLERRPALSGLLLGLLSYKPQLGVLFPIALVFGGYWRVFGWACASTIFWTMLSGAVFGFGTYAGFIHGLFVIGSEATSTVPGYLPNLQSLYGLARCLGVPAGISWLLQACLSCACVVAVAALWRKKTDFELKAAGLASLIPLACFYFEAYDLALLSVSLAFLYRHRPFDMREWFVTTCAFLSFGAFWWERAHPATMIACAAVGIIVCMRLRTASAAAARPMIAESCASASC